VRFWDSSAIVPLLIEQPSSRQADAWLAADDQMAVWTMTSVEIASALWRLVREGELDPAQARAAESRLDDVVQASHVVVDTEGVKARAVRLLRVHPLRAADALQLAAALGWSLDRPAGRTLHTFDSRLADAARREGFEV
jgi:uncharacterized protein